MAAVLVAADKVATGPQPGGAQSADEWLAGWHETVLAAAEKPAPLEDYPMLRGAATRARLRGSTSSAPRRAGPTAAAPIRAGVRAATAERDPVLVLRGPDGIEHRSPPSARGTVTELTGEIDIGTAALGAAWATADWVVGVETTGPGELLAAELPKVNLPSSIVDSRPVLVTVRAERLELQVGVVRRSYLRPEPEDAEITESAGGTVLSLPLHPSHSADTSSVPGRLLIGKLPVPAELDLSGDRPRLKACLSGLSGSYPLSVAFGHPRPVLAEAAPLVDGIGQMELVHRSAGQEGSPAGAAGAAAGGVRPRSGPVATPCPSRSCPVKRLRR